MHSTALMTDRYELTMLDAALHSGQAERRAVFEVFARSLPRGRSYGIVAGTDRALDAILGFRFGDDELAWLAKNDLVSERALDYLADFSFSGDAWGFAEGDVYFANSPLFTIESTFAEAVVLETVLLSIFNYDSAVASAVARMVDAAQGRPIFEGGARRAHESAAVAAARAAYLAGATATSNLEAGHRYSIPTVGTIGHAFILAHRDEREAFEAQRALLGSTTTYLVDTYDTAAGIATAVDVAGLEIGGVRLDSGDLAAEAAQAREILDDLGATATKIMVSGDLDEWKIDALSPAPIDGYLVGTSLITGSGHPTAALVYKLVAIDFDEGLRPVAKRSAGKPTTGGRKAAFRQTVDGTVTHDLLVVDNERPINDVDGPGRRLQVPLLRDGHPVGERSSLVTSRAWSQTCRAELPDDARGPDATREFSSVIEAGTPQD